MGSFSTTARMPAGVLMAGTGRPQSSIQKCLPRLRARAFFTSAGTGLKMPRLRPLAWAVSPATALASDSASSRANPCRSATTAAHSVSTGARLMVMTRSAKFLEDAVHFLGIERAQRLDGDVAERAQLYGDGSDGFVVGRVGGQNEVVLAEGPEDVGDLRARLRGHRSAEDQSELQ